MIAFIDTMRHRFGVEVICRVLGATESGFIELGAKPSTGSIGDSYDNALAEAINGRYKAELIRRRGTALP